MDNYEILDSGVIKQRVVDKITYDYSYSDKYNKHGERGNYLSYLRFGVLLGVLQRPPTSIVDVGYGNGSFLKVCKENVERVYGCDISDYPVPEGCKKIDLRDISNIDVTCFFDSLEHFDDIDFIRDLDTQYVFISVPWCHKFSEDWFLKWYHRRPNEHLWHFNLEALKNVFQARGYDIIYSSNFEDSIRKNASAAYYPNILSCVFKKRDPLKASIEQYYTDKVVVVTGGTGFIGQHIVNALLEQKVRQIIVFDRTIKYKWDDDRVTYIKGDLLRDLDTLDQLRFDVLFHEAVWVEEEGLVDTNFHRFVDIVKICCKMGSKLVYASSNPMMDDYIRANIDNITIPVIGLHYSDVYGSGGEHKGGVVSQMVRKIRDGVDVPLFDSGEQVRDFVYVKDVARCNIYAGFHENTGIYNCGSGVPSSFSELFKILKSYYMTDANIVSVTQPQDVPTLADIAPTSTHLRFYPSFDIKKGIYDYISN